MLWGFIRNKMKKIIKIDDFIKLNLRIGQVEENNKKEIKIRCLSEKFISKLKIDAMRGENIVISAIGNKLVVPVIRGDIPLIPEKKIENGAKVR